MPFCLATTYNVELVHDFLPDGAENSAMAFCKTMFLGGGLGSNDSRIDGVLLAHVHEIACELATLVRNDHLGHTVVGNPLLQDMPRDVG